MLRTTHTARNAWMSIAQVATSAVVLFFLYRYVLTRLGINQLGIWSVLLASVSVTKVSELGLSSSATRFVAHHLARGEHRKAYLAVETAGLSVAVIMATLLIIGYPVAKAAMKLFVPPEIVPSAAALLPAALLSVWLSSLGGVATGALDGCQRIDIRSLLLIAANILFLALGLTLVGSFGLVGLVWAQITQNVFVLVAGWWLLRRALPGLALAPWRWSRSLFREMVGYGAQFQLVGVATMLYEPIVKGFVSKFGGLAVVGYFEMASQLVTRLRALFVAGSQVLVPLIATNSELSPERVCRLYVESYRIILFLALPFYAIIIALAPLVCLAWIGRIEPMFVLSCVCLAAAWFINSINCPAYFCNLGSGNLRWNTIAHIAIGLSNALLGWGLGSAFGGAGVIIGWAFALAAGSMVIMLSFHRERGIPPGTILPRDFRVYAFFCALACATGPISVALLRIDVSAITLSVSSVVVLIALVGIPMWRHPMRSHIAGLIGIPKLSNSLGTPLAGPS